MFYPPMMGYLIVTAVSVLMIVAQRRQAIGRNSVIGIRTRYTRASDASWKAGQRAGRPYLIAMAAISICHAVALFFAEISDATTTGHVLSVVGWVLVVICAVLAGRAANSAARSVG